MTSLPRDEAFIQSLLRRTQGDGPDNRASRAALRRGLGKAPGEAPEVFPYVVPWLGTDPRRREEWAYYLVAALLASHPVSWPGDAYRTNLGASLRWACDRRSSPAAVERRFVATLNADADDLSDHLRHAVSLCRAEEVPVNWLQLLRDIRDWDRDDRVVQRRWAGAFWATSDQTDAPAATDAGEPSVAATTITPQR